MQVQRVNILYISDLHYSKEREDDHRVINHAFLSDLKKLSTTELRPHLVVFSGDLVRSGDDNASYYDAMSDVFEPLLQIIGLDEGRLFLAPGNHDVQRSVIQASEVVQQGLETTLTNRDKLNDFYIKSRHYEYIKQKFSNYLEFRDLLSNKHLVEADLFVEVYYIRDLDVAIVIVNTAWMSRGGLSEKDDRQRILVAEISLRRALGKLPDTKARILIGHHPHDWLAEYAQNDYRRILEREFTVYLHGHMHEPMSANVRSTMGSALVHQGGALYTGRERYNGYGIISISPEYGYSQVNLRTFFEKPEQFDAAVDIVSGGQWYPSPEAQAFWTDLPRPLAPDQIATWVAERVGPELQQSLDEGFTSSRALKNSAILARVRRVGAAGMLRDAGFG